ncbi:hypothetical protein C8P63_11120 [Melghirimyces profundicolus]|uniref:Uncharacterized protein n=1 Tax=Melghirimyces profundicolus TaxID=1242148 RepID=A0A2T6BU29_9BACL|nr:hypothetical protein [Melghirimyces profundicolus]PTX59590.1 hypothetical protein C8P63_11120 [Melghirimyces profundicolus]
MLTYADRITLEGLFQVWAWGKGYLLVPEGSWDLPPYKSPEFIHDLYQSGMTLEEFRKLPVYRIAVKRGLIKDDEWVGPNTWDGGEESKEKS